MSRRPEAEAVWDLLDALYAGALDGVWDPVLGHAESVFDAGVSLGVMGPSLDRDVRFFGASFFGPDELEAYRNHYHEVDPTRPERTGIRAGRIEYLRDRFDSDAFERSELFHDFLRPLGVAPDALTVRLPVPSELGTVMLGMWFRKKGAWGDADQRLLFRFLPHLQRAGQLHLRFACLAHERAGLLSCLDHLPAAAFLIDATGRVVRMNGAAERLVSRGQRLRCVAGRLRCPAPEDDRRLAQKLDEVLRGSGAPDFRDVLTIQSGPAAAPLEAMVTRLAVPEPAGTGALVAAVFVRDPAARSVSPVPLLRRLYGLSRAEAELAARLADGIKPADAAEQQGIAKETARSQLKRIFAKTGTRRQAELVRLLACSLSRLQAEDPEGS